MYKDYADYVARHRDRARQRILDEEALLELAEAQIKIIKKKLAIQEAYGGITHQEESSHHTQEEAEAMVTRRGTSMQPTPSHPAVRAEAPAVGRSKELQEQLQSISIERSGNKIIIPIGMSPETVIEAMYMKIEEDSKRVEVEYEFQLMVPEGALALFYTLNDIYGFVKLMDTPGFFGPEPPTLLTVQVSPDHTERIPWGRFGVPGLTGHLQTSIRWSNKIPYFRLVATIPAGEREQVQAIADHMKARTDSIYRGQALKVNFPEPDDRTPIQDFFPKFSDLPEIEEDQLIFSRDVQDIIDTALFTPIRQTAICREHGAPLKRGVLLEGPPGVGKTLTASVTATMAKKYGWTFIQCDNVNDLPRVYRFAMRQQPAVIFCEDLDRVVKEAPERSDIVNDILNSIDGIESKKNEIILVLTTNYVGRITEAALRPGRIDALVPVRPPDAEAAQRLITLYAGESMPPTEDLTAAGILLQGKSASFIREVVERSKLSAIRRLTGLGQTLTIRARDVEVAAHGMEAHNELLKPKEHDEREENVKAAELLVEGLRSILAPARANGVPRSAPLELQTFAGGTPPPGAHALPGGTPPPPQS